MILRILILWLFASAGFTTAGAETLLRQALANEPASLDPRHQISASENRLLGDLFEGLTRRMPDGSVGQGVAYRWVKSTDALHWTFFLRDTAKWSDGTPVTAEDFVAAWRAALESRAVPKRVPAGLQNIAGAASILRGEAGASFGAVAVEPHVLQVDLVAPMPDFDAEVLRDHMQPVPKRLQLDPDADASDPLNFVGNGAYRLVEWTRQTRLVLERSPTYWDTSSVQVDKVIFYPIEDAAEQFKRFRFNEIDITSDVPLKQLDWVKHHWAAELIVLDENSTVYLSINQTDEPWTHDQNIRRALSLAIDRNVLANQVLDGVYAPTEMFVPKSAFDFKSHGAPDWPVSQTQREDLARRLWSASTVTKPRRIKVIFANSEKNKHALVAIGAMWRRVFGLELELAPAEFNKVIALKAQHDYSVALERWLAFTPQEYLDHFDSRAGSSNYPRYHSQAFDQLLDLAKSSPDMAVRSANFARAETVLLSDAVIIPLLHTRSYFLVSRRIAKRPLLKSGQYISKDFAISQMPGNDGAYR